MYQMYRSFSPRPLTVATSITLILAIICPLFKHTQAMKSKVPIYMPIPIPIPMPMGPQAPVPPPGPQHHQHQAGPTKYFHQIPYHRHQDQGDDGGGGGGGEGEVKKIYLLQPVPRSQPQPQLKGGGFMGPIQNHIHLVSQQPTVASPGKHRHSPSGHHQQQQHQGASLEGDAGGSDRTRPSSGAQHSSHKSEVKILPIVVIPPIAPVPPIQIAPAAAPALTSTNSVHRLMFSPQFNNFLVSAADQQQQQPQQAKRYHGGSRNFADYGGSLGASVFRENYASRSRPARNSRISMTTAANNNNDYGGADFAHQYPPQQRRSTSRSRWPSRGDYDYNDYDYDASAAGREAPQSSYGRGGGGDELIGASRRRQYRTLAPAPSGQRRYRASDGAGGGGNNRFKSIRDIIDAHKAARSYEDYEQAISGDGQQLDGYGQSGSAGGVSSDSAYESASASHDGQAALYRQQEQQLHNLAAELAQLDSGSGAISGQQQQQRGARLLRNGAGSGGVQATSYEILLDELGTQLVDSRQPGQRPGVQSQQLQQDLSALYYDRSNASGSIVGVDSEPTIGQLRLKQRQQQYHNQRQALEAALTEGRDIFDDDEWRFDSIKSVTHVAANAGATTKNATTTTMTIGPGPGSANKTDLKQQANGLVRPSNLEPVRLSPLAPIAARSDATSATNRTRIEPNPHQQVRAGSGHYHSSPAALMGTAS